MPPEVMETSETDSESRRLVLVTGAGRSGTSTVAGSLHYLGLHVPLPVLGANESNPRGFFESKWPLNFHKKILARAVVDPFDARPEALERMTSALTGEDREELLGWLSDEARQARQIVVKDPRSSWVTGLWADVAASEGLGLGYLTMLRHPAEVVGSRATYYAADRDAESVRRYQVVKLAGWINANLLVERQTRGQRRTFVRYYDLIENWRTAMSAVRTDLDLSFNADLESGSPHPVDDFIDPDLRRIRVSWEELDVPLSLREIAEDVWTAYDELIDRRVAGADAEARLDAISERYASLYKDAQAIAHDTIAAGAKVARRAEKRQMQEKMRKKVAKAKESARAAQATSRPSPGVIWRAASAVRRRVRSL